MDDNIRQNILLLGATIRDVLETLNKAICGVVFIADHNKRILGLLTDGDIRRAILSGADMHSAAEKYMTRNFVHARQEWPKESFTAMLSEKIRYLPVLDDSGRLVDLLSWTEVCRTHIMEPALSGNELKYVTDCIATNWISSQGNYVKDFEKKFAAYHNTAHALTTTSGTTALHLALVAMGIGHGDEVIVPDLTFGASANTVIHAGGTPVFVDVTDYWNIDPDKIEAAITSRTKAIMPVHLYGQPCDMDPIMDIATRHDLRVIEDCAEALGARYKGQLVGTFGDVGCFSFFSNKVITTGEGGMALTNSNELNNEMQLWRDHGMSPEKRYWHQVPGFNYRMTNIQAAIGVAQLEQIDNFLAHRKKIAALYTEFLRNIPGITLPAEMDWADNIFWLYSILVDENICNVSRDKLMQGLKEEGVETRPVFPALHNQPPFVKNDHTFPVTDKIAMQGMSLPYSYELTNDDVKQICELIKKIISHYTIINKACLSG
jgi:perosamine synthetase